MRVEPEALDHVVFRTSRPGLDPDGHLVEITTDEVTRDGAVVS
jgi:hypothetical protein